MRKSGAAIALVLVAVGGALVLPRIRSGASASGAPISSSPASTAHRLAVRSDDEGLSLRGIVRRADGLPAVGVAVWLSASAQLRFESLRCPVCGRTLVSCLSKRAAVETLKQVALSPELFEPGAKTQTDGQGRFRFDRLKGVSFDVLAIASDGASAFQNRAPPGLDVELRLGLAKSFEGQVWTEDGRSLDGARVQVFSRGMAPPRTIVTDAAGRFTASGLGEGPYFMLVSHDGFLPALEGRAEAQGSSAAITLRLPRALEVRLSRDGRPADGVVRLSAEHDDRLLETHDGVARFEGLHPGSVQISASSRSSSGGPRSVSLVDAVTRASLELEPGGTIAVTVLDEQGQPVASPTVKLRSAGEVVEGSDEPWLTLRPRTGELANLGPLPLGTYVVSAAAPGFTEVETPVRLQGANAALELSLPHALLLSGRVLDEFGRAVANLDVVAAPTGETATTDEEGRFSLEVSSAGLYTVQAHHSSWGGASVPVKAPATGIELRLDSRASLDVEVVGRSGPLEGARATLVRPGPTGSFQSDVLSGANGHVVLRGVPGGRYTLIVDQPRHTEAHVSDVELVEGQTRSLRVSLEEGGSISGEVVDESGRPIPMAKVWSVLEGSHLEQETDGRGHFELQGLPAVGMAEVGASADAFSTTTLPSVAIGTTNLRVQLAGKIRVHGRVIDSSGAPLRHFAVNSETFDAPDGRFEIRRAVEDGHVQLLVTASGHQLRDVDLPAAPDLGDIVLTPLPMLSGVVVDDSGKPVENATVTCTICDSSAVTDSSGAFALASPTPVIESDETESRSEPVRVTADRGALTGSTLAAEGPLRIVVRPRVKISGTFYLPDGSPAAGRELAVFDVDRGELLDAVTGPDGKYELSVAPGRYRLPAAPDEAPIVPLVQTFIQGAQSLDLGPSPGSGSLDVRLGSGRTQSVWIVAGDPAATDEATLSETASGVVLFSPQGDSARVDGLTPGSHSVIWLEAGARPILRRVTVTRGQVTSVAP